VVAQIISGPLALPLSIEPILPGEDEVAAASRLLERLYRVFPKAFDVVTVDGLYGRAGFFNLAQSHHKHVIAVSKPAQREHCPPTRLDSQCRKEYTLDC